MNDAPLLKTLAALSREFGSTTYVRGGGGNTSAKTDSVLYVKPSGVSLADITPEQFLPLDRHILAKLPETTFPAGVNEREAAVAKFMAAAVLPGHSGRASVEAPLHNYFPQRFVIHTHPAIVNAMTCGKDGETVSRRLFPESVWMPPIEPGYILSTAVHAILQKHRAEKQRDLDMLFLANHGVFIAGNTEDDIRRLYGDLLKKTTDAVRSAGIHGEPDVQPAPSAEEEKRVAGLFHSVIGGDAACHAVMGRFRIPAGPISPDHIVYHKAYMYNGPADPETIRDFQKKYGYWPKVAATPEGVFGFGPNAKNAALALEFAWDGALIEHYAQAFGGIVYMKKPLVDFIENWEVESYRRKVAT